MLKDEQNLTDLVKPLSLTRERSAHWVHPTEYKSTQDDREREVYSKLGYPSDDTPEDESEFKINNI